MRRLLALALLSGLVSTVAWADPAVPTGRLEIVLVGVPPAPASPDGMPAARVEVGMSESDALAHLELLRDQWHARSLRIAVWHPGKVSDMGWIGKALGTFPIEQPTLCLVRLPAREGSGGLQLQEHVGNEARSTRYRLGSLHCLYRIELNAPSAVDLTAQVWANEADVKVPNVAAGTALSEGMHGLHAGPEMATSNLASHPMMIDSSVYQTESVRNAAGEVEKRSQLVYLAVKDLPLQNDGVGRLAVLDVLECARTLQQSLSLGIDNPRGNFEHLLQARDQLLASQAYSSFPVMLRPDLRRLYRSLDQVEAIYRQLNPNAK